MIWRPLRLNPPKATFRIISRATSTDSSTAAENQKGSAMGRTRFKARAKYRKASGEECCRTCLHLIIKPHNTDTGISHFLHSCEGDSKSSTVELDCVCDCYEPAGRTYEEVIEHLRRTWEETLAREGKSPILYYPGRYPGEGNDWIVNIESLPGRTDPTARAENAKESFSGYHKK